jgi:allophanate hydrolase
MNPDLAPSPSPSPDQLEDIGSLQLAAVRAYYREPSNGPRQLIAAVLARCAQHADANIWISLAPRAQLDTEADELIRRWPDPALRPALWGVPIAVKDNVDVAGLTTTAGCPDFAYVAADDAYLVHRLKEAGALIIGKTNMDQFASGLTGTRSPYGICRSPFNRDHIGGGSSSGSGLAVSLGLVSAAIGTDTAGSGRVPAALNNIVGSKPSRGLVSTRGIVPACRSLDCPSVFALSVADAATVLNVIAGPDRDDPFSRSLPIPPACPAAPPLGSRIGFCRLGIDDFAGDPLAAHAYGEAVDRLRAGGAELIEIDFAPLRASGELLYNGPWVAERLTVLESWIDSHPDSLSPVTATVLGQARSKSAVDAFRGFHRLTELSGIVSELWDSVDAVVLPTVPTTPTVAATVADPHRINSLMGRYTMFCNLLDLAAVAVPSTILANGLPSGISFYGPAGSDAALAALAADYQRRLALSAGYTGHPVLASPSEVSSDEDQVLLAVVGAHRTGQPLHPQLAGLGATLVATTFTAARYQLFALPGADLARPGLVRTSDGGASIEVELHRIDSAALGRLLVQIPAPLTLGTVTLLDGRTAVGFLCEAYAARTAQEITQFKSWPNYLASQAI